jgi:ABC-2 type transport system ATP-binding protein
LGPNGAGKTTTIGICTTRTLPTSGQARIAGIDVVAHPALARRSIGVVPQYNTLDRSLTIFENLYFHCKYFGFNGADARQRANTLLEQFHLLERAKAFPAQLSGGLQQRIQIARAIAHRPAVLFLDEPSAGLDPQSRIAMWDAVRSLREEGITVVLTTQYMEEADELCDRVAIIDHGKVLALDAPERLKTTLGANTRIELALRSEESTQPLAETLRALPQIRSVEPISGGLRLFAQGIDGLLPELVRATHDYGVRDISINEPSLETVFIQLTGRDLRE